MGYIDPWQIPTPSQVRRSNYVRKDGESVEEATEATTEDQQVQEGHEHVTLPQHLPGTRNVL
jgi:hypothetical protein